VAVWDPAAFTALELPSCTEAAITLKFQLENVASSPVEAEVVARIGSTPAIEVRRKVTLRAGALEEVVLTPAEFPGLRMQNPRLWWPRGYGGQPLYRLTVEVRRNGAVSHRQVTRFGVRQLGYFYHPSEYARTLVPTPDGQDPYKYPPMKAARVFTVNGRPIRMAGGSIVPDFLLSWSAQRYRDEVRLMAEGNHTVIRIWGGGLIMPDAFYDEADRRGMLVWQDMARSSFEVGWRKKEAELPPVEKDLYLANMRDSILRLRGRTSLLVWCGTNEAAMQTDIGKALQDEMLPALDPTRPWLPSSSTEPPWAKEPLGVRSFGPYVLQDLQYYFEQYARSPDFLFKDEIGLESVPRYNSIAKAIPDLGGSGGSGSWITPALLDHGLPEKSLGTRMADRVGQPAGLADFVSMSELLSAQGMRAIVEAANKNRPRNPGTMFWMSNAGWLDCMYQLYDWYLHPTAGYYAVKSAARPLHVQYTVDDGTLQVVSTLAGSRPVRIHATLVSPEGRTEAARDYEVTAQADATTMVGPAPAEIGDGSLHFLRLDLRDREGRELDRLVTWTQKEERWGAMLHMPAVRVNANVLARSSLRGEAQYRILVRNEGSVPALHVWVEVIKGAQGEEVLPSFWSDNALTMMPGEERELTVRFRKAQLQGATPRIMVEGFNVIPREINAAPLAIEVRDLTYEGRGALKIVCSQTGAAGPRWTTWPLAISVDGRLIRYLRVAVKTGVQSTVRLNLQLARGAHRIEAGGKVIEIPAERS
ncbi:MAG: hypothetical protein M1436_06695, partial [Acidobacteria bacterium]|nr:hypothetical protein [Acidobacteriota bacterium]